MKKNNSDNYESIKFFLNKDKHPIAFAAKLKELVECGMSKEDAESAIPEMEFEMEIYYSDGLGLFMVESEAVESCTIIDPYTGNELEDFEDED